MAYWLFKSEPGTWSWQNQLEKGDEGEGWDGVRNHQAGNNMKAMQVQLLGSPPWVAKRGRRSQESS